MTRALQSRYAAYEGLEQSVIKLMTKFDAIEKEFRQKLAEASNPGAVYDKTLMLRSQNPELWDLERDHHRVQSEQLGELARQSARVVELMQQVEALGPNAEKLEAELGHLRMRYDNAVANASDAERVSNSKIERLEQRVSQLEPLTSMHEAARRELAMLHKSAQEHAQAAATEIQALQGRIVFLTEAEKRAQALQVTMANRERECAAHTQRTGEVERELRDTKANVQAAEQRCTALTQERDATKKVAADIQVTLERTRDSQSELQRDLDKCRAQLVESEKHRKTREAEVADLDHALQQAQAEVAAVRAELGDTRSHSKSEQDKLEQAIKAAKAENAIYRLKLDHHSSHVEQAWSVLTELKPMLETLEQKLKSSDDPPPALPQPAPEKQQQSQPQPASEKFDLSLLDEQ